MTGHSEYCQCWRCVQEGIEEASPEAAEDRAMDAEAERAERGLAAADARTMNYPDG